MGNGLVSLVGAGPGHPGLITVRGAELLRTADVVVFDRLAAPELLDLAPKDAERVYVGKAPGRHAMSQEEINDLLVKRGQAGMRVVRLKGGDPFVFGRGGEEALALANANVRFEVVPGITSAIAAPAFAGIPVTHREVASSVTFVTGHEDPKKPAAAVDWARLANSADTLVVLMGVERLATIAEQLVANGRAAATPAAVVEWGTLARQRIVTDSLAGISAAAERAGIGAPAVLVVGDVVGLREHLAWFGVGPLSGTRVLVTRARDQASYLSRLLAERGAFPVEFPAIAIEWLVETTLLDVAISKLDSYDWVVFTSANGVTAVFRRLDARGHDVRAFGRARLCAIGPATAEALAARGLRADWVPPDFLTTAILDGFRSRGVDGQRLLLPRADIADPKLASGLRELGAEVDDVTAYRTVLVAEGAQRLVTLLESGQIDVATFASSSTVRNVCAGLGDRRSLLEQVQTVCIGPVTAATARELGLTVDAIADVHTIDGLVEAVERVVARGPQRAAALERTA